MKRFYIVCYACVRVLPKTRFYSLSDMKYSFCIWKEEKTQIKQ